jgi:L-lysine 6-transaminase
MTIDRTSIVPVASIAWDAADAVSALREHVTGDLLDIVVDLDASHGCRLRDLRDGTEYLDMTMFFSSAPLGHNHPALCDAEFESALVRAGRTKPSNPDFATVEQARFAQTFRRLAGEPELPLLFFVEGGTLAVENALKIAFDWKTKHNANARIAVQGGKVLHLEHAFHGRSGYTLSLTNTEPAKIRDYPKFDWPRIPSPSVPPGPAWNTPQLLPVEQAALEAARAAIHRYGAEIACFLYEPIQGEGGDRHLRPEFLRAMQDLCLQHDILTVADEVQTGGGLTGRPWAHQVLGLKPDLVAFGKRVQVCGVMGGRRVLDIPDNAFREASRLGSTWGGSLVDMVRGTRILEVIESEHLLDHVRRTGDLLVSKLGALAAEFPDQLLDARGRGLMCAITFREPACRDQVIELARERHRTLFLPCGPDSLRWRPPLTVQPEDLAEAVAGLRQALIDRG